MITNKTTAGVLLNTLFGGSGSYRTTDSLLLYTGAAPANAQLAASGTLLAQCAQVGTYADASTGGTYPTLSMTASGGICFQDSAANATGTCGYWRLTNGATCYLQGTVGAGSGELNLNTLSVTLGQLVTIFTFAATLSNLNN